MKKRLIFLLILSLFFISIVNLISAVSNSTVTGSTIDNSITGKATNADLAFSIPVLGLPYLQIISPENSTYITSKNIQLNFISSAANSIWYNIDNGANTSLSGNTTFNTTNGQHTLYLYANNSQGNISASVIFLVNESYFIVDYNDFYNKGTSTNFNSSSYTDLQNLSGVVLENSNYGKIQFNNALNLTNISGNALNLDNYTNISSNHIEINSITLPNMNSSATLYLYNLTFTNPEILMDGTVCLSSVCTEINYSSGTLIFNVTHFTTYSAQETPTTTSSQSGGSGSSGGGGSGASIVFQQGANFTLSTYEMHVSLNQGETTSQQLTIQNTGSVPLDIGLSYSPSLTLYLRINKDSFTLAPGEEKTITIDFLARENSIPDLYLGEIYVRGGGIEQRIMTAVEIESANPLLDVSVSIPSQYQQVYAGSNLVATISLYNLGLAGTTDIAMEYIMKDVNGNIILDQSEDVALQTQEGFVRNFQIPNNLQKGKYFLYVKASYNGKIASTSSDFNVISPSNAEQIYLVAIIILVLVVSVLVYFIVHRRIHTKRYIRKVSLNDLIKKS